MGHRYIAIEGPIGVGKTSLARRLAAHLGMPTLLEMAQDNPFLERFYSEPRSVALQTQLFFLFQRFGQLSQLSQRELFAPGLVADFMLEKDPLFARLTLDEDELSLYYQVYDRLTLQVPPPDLVIYLQAPVEVLLQRIQGRGISYEQDISDQYLADLSRAYLSLFHRYDRAPLLVVNAAQINLVDSDADFEALLAEVRRTRKGRHYFNPLAASM